MAIASENRSVPELFSDLVGQLSTLFRKEVQLVRTELSEKVGQALTGVGLMIGGAVLLIASLGVLLAALVDTLEALGVGEPWAAFIVGILVAVLGALLVRFGLSRLNVANLKPEKTVEQLGRDAAVAREQTR